MLTKRGPSVDGIYIPENDLDIYMALSIKHPEADRLARRLAEHIGESLTDAIITALRERLRREQGRTRVPRLHDEIGAIRQRCAALAVKDRRSADEVLGYDATGLPR